ncbi:MAG: Na+/H+ antiporter NhaA [Bryobacteraceae bacterium]
MPLFMVRVYGFLASEAAAGVVLILAAALAMTMANSPWQHFYQALLDVPAEVRIGSFSLTKPILLWINDGLMAVFFFLVGLEVKYETRAGSLSNLRRAALPAFAAAGGMAIPSLVYSALNWSDPAALEGWAIPASTDIAFALGILALAGNSPPALRAFLLSVAIFDDLGAVVIIAMFYTGSLSQLALAAAAILFAGVVILNRLGVTSAGMYLLFGVPMWVCLLKSGIHATLAGVLVAIMIPGSAPARAIQSPPSPLLSSPTLSPLKHIERYLNPWVKFGVLPVFAFANAGVPLGGSSISDLWHPVALGIALGLLIGKPIGILAASFAAVRLGYAVLPDGVGWPRLAGASLLCGVGFTMSLFIASLAFERDGAFTSLGLERIGVLSGSILASLAGFIAIRRAPARAGAYSALAAPPRPPSA